MKMGCPTLRQAQGRLSRRFCEKWEFSRKMSTGHPMDYAAYFTLGVAAAGIALALLIERGYLD
jgi:hypothetical protein